MATYAELKSLFGHGPLIEKIEVAVCDKARAIMVEATPSPSRLAWASGAFANSQAEAARLVKYVLLANKVATLATILTVATQTSGDATIQANVDTAIDKFCP